MGLKEEVRITDIMNELADLDKQDGDLGLDLGDRQKERFENWLSQQITHGSNFLETKKGIEKWLKDSDKNSKYFHCLANHRRICNYVGELFITVAV